MLNRRQLLSVGLTTSALVASGCARSLVRPPKCPHFEVDDQVLVIDAHCHIFNGSDLQVSGFINEVKLAKPIWSPFRPLGHLLQAIAWEFAPSPEEELRWLNRQTARPSEQPRARLAAAPGSSDLADFETDSAERLASFFQKAEQRDAAAVLQFKQVLIEIYQRQGLVAQRADTLTFTSSNIATLFELEKSSMGGLSPLSFLATFFRYRTQNAWAMLQMYGCESKIGVDMLCPALVDFDLWIGSPQQDAGRTRSNIVDQTNLLGEIARATEGRVYGYAPFNPLRASCDSSYAAQLFAAVLAGKCAGFKLYPPMGFSAFNNQGSGLANLPNCRRPDGTPVPISRQRLDQVLGDFFERCNANEIPVIAHGSPSNASRPGSEQLAAPQYWRNLMGGYAETFLQDRSRLRISLGHMGGDGADLNRKWRNEIVDLMDAKPGRVFADLSFQDSILDLDKQALMQDLQFLADGTKHPNAVKQTLYGSDWSMLAMQALGPRYLDRFQESLSYLGVNLDTLHNLLGKNSSDFLGLSEGQAPGARREAWLRLGQGEGDVTS